MRPVTTKIDPYKVLEIPKNASQEDIKKQFRSLSKKYHPDVHTSEEDKKKNEDKFKEINEAYEILNDPQKRAAYDNPQPHLQGMPFNPFGNGFHFDFNGGGFGINIEELFGQQFRHATGRTTSTQIISTNVSVDLLKAIEGGEVVTDTQFGTIKFNLPQGTQPGTQLQVQLKKEGNNEVILQCRIDVTIPQLPKEKIDKLKEILTK